MILIGRVLRCEGSDDRPLVYWRGSYRRLPAEVDDLAHEGDVPQPPCPEP